MPIIDITRTYNDTALLSESDLDNIKTGTEAFINTTKIDGTNIQAEGIDASLKFTVGSISAAKIPSNAATTVNLAESPDGASTAKINDLAVTTAKINDLAVTTAKINDAAVTYAKLAPPTATTSSSSGSFSTSNLGFNNYIAVTNLSATITTTGRPVMLTLIPNTSGSNIAFPFGDINRIRFKRDSTVISFFGYGSFIADETNSYYNTTIDQPSAGTYTYTVEVAHSIFGGTPDILYVINIRLHAIEL